MKTRAKMLHEMSHGLDIKKRIGKELGRGGHAKKKEKKGKEKLGLSRGSKDKKKRKGGREKKARARTGEEKEQQGGSSNTQERKGNRKGSWRREEKRKQVRMD